MTQAPGLGWSSVLLEGLDHEGEPEPVSGARRPQPQPVDEGEDVPVRAPSHGRYKPMPAAGNPSSPYDEMRGGQTSGFAGQVRLKGQVPVADWTMTPEEVASSSRYRDLYRARPITDEERATFTYRDLDAEQPEANPQTQYRQSLADRKPAPVERPKTSFESVRARNRRDLDNMFRRHFGETYRD